MDESKRSAIGFLEKGIKTYEGSPCSCRRRKDHVRLGGKKVMNGTALRANLLDFYGDLSLPWETKKDSARWQSVLFRLEQLKLFAPAPIVAASPED